MDKTLSTATDLKPKLRLGPTESATEQTVVPFKLRTQAAARSHNVFRPDIYRVSEGYLN